MDDCTIIDLYWRRSEDAIRETAAKYGAYCRSVARSLLSNAQDEEECVNDTWIKAWNAMPDNRPSHLRLFLGSASSHTAPPLPPGFPRTSTAAGIHCSPVPAGCGETG